VRIEAIGIERVIVLGMSFEPGNGLRVLRVLWLTQHFQQMLINGNASAVFRGTGTLARDAPWIFLFEFAQRNTLEHAIAFPAVAKIIFV
jgi:hypothetical protein